MRRPTRILGLLVLIIVVALAIDYVRVRAKNRRAFHAISQCGGRMGSIPCWPFGTEYRITFSRALTSDELDQLGELNSLRGFVGVAFVDCELSTDQVREATARLHNCALYRVIDGEMSALNGQAKAGP